MRSIKRYTLPVGVVALLASCGGNTAQLPTEPALSMDRPLTERQERRTMVTLPMRGTWDNSESPPVANPPAGCLVKIETAQTGTATHLGHFTGEGSTCVTTQTPSESPPFWDHDPAPPYGVMDFENEMKWTAANGDELWLKPNGGCVRAEHGEWSRVGARVADHRGRNGPLRRGDGPTRGHRGARCR